MSVSQTKKCPICDTPYTQSQKRCSQCSWDLTLYHDGFLSNEQSLKVHISARKIYSYLQKYREMVKQMQQKIKLSQKKEDDLHDENDRLKQELEESKLLPLQIYELELQINKLQTQIKQLESEKRENQIEVNQSLEQYVINQDNRNTSFVSKKGIQVTPTKKSLEDIYLNKADEIVFEVSNQNDYWIVELESTVYCLLPNKNLDIKRNLKAIRHFFELVDYQDNTTWEVVKLALVEKINID